MDVRHISPVTDYFVIATGSSNRQMRSVMSRIEELGLPRRFRPLGRDGTDALEGESHWLLTDFVDVIVHFFTPEGRSYYDLDGLWGDAERVEWAQAGKASSIERRVQRGLAATAPVQR